MNPMILLVIIWKLKPWKSVDKPFLSSLPWDFLIALNIKTSSITQKKRDILLRKQPLLDTPLAHTNRYKKSPLPYLTNLLNEYFEKKIEEQDYINISSSQADISHWWN